jgi:hypothetical protein
MKLPPRTWLAFALLFALGFIAKADGITSKNVVGMEGIYNSGSNGVGMAGVNNGGGASAPLTPCAAGALDFSDATGCNLSLYMVMLR